jgi:hypothetical protein
LFIRAGLVFASFFFLASSSAQEGPGAGGGGGGLPSVRAVQKERVLRA